MADRLVVDSIVLRGGRIEAVGNHLEHDRDFRGCHRLNLRGKTVIPGLTDAHTHFYNVVLGLREISLDGVDSLEKCLAGIRAFAKDKPRNGWIVGSGFSPDRLAKRIEPDRHLLDDAVGGRPAFIFYKDMHSAWVSSRALQVAGIDRRTRDPRGGEIVREPDRSPSGILREGPGYGPVYDIIPRPSDREMSRLYSQALKAAYAKGVTGVHTFDGPEAFAWLVALAERCKLGLRVNYYAPAATLPQLEKSGVRYGAGTEFLRLAGVKIFADGSLGSQTALCFGKYKGSKDNHGIEVTSTAEIKRLLRRAARLGLPAAVHAIGDKAVANVIDAMENFPAPRGTRHRIEHLQLVRRADLKRIRDLGIVASMQPSHCPSDIHMLRKYWGARSRNAYVFRNVIDTGIPLAFGSDAPIEPLDPLTGIVEAVRRARKGSRDVFEPDQRITAHEALHAYTAGAAMATSEEHTRGYLLPGYPADLVILDRDLTRTAPQRLYDIKVLATILDGTPRFLARSFKL